MLPEVGSRYSRPRVCRSERRGRGDLEIVRSGARCDPGRIRHTPAEPELRIACEGGKERLGRIEAIIRMAEKTASSFLSHLNTAIHEGPDDVAQTSGRAAVDLAAHGRNDEVLAEPE